MLAKFYNYADGCKVSNETINKWLNEARKDIMGGKMHTNTASGDTVVSTHRFNDIVYFLVCTSSGYLETSCHFHELEELEFDFRR